MIKRYRGTFEPENNGPIIAAEFVEGSDFDSAIAQIQAAVRLYGRHLTRCDTQQDWSWMNSHLRDNCTCGLKDLLASFPAGNSVPQKGAT